MSINRLEFSQIYISYKMLILYIIGKVIGNSDYFESIGRLYSIISSGSWCSQAQRLSFSFVKHTVLFIARTMNKLSSNAEMLNVK